MLTADYFAQSDAELEALNQRVVELYGAGKYTEAIPLAERYAEAVKARHGPDHPDVATTLNNLVQLLQATNRLAEAEPLMRRALAIDEKSYGPEHPQVAIYLNNLAQLLQDTNRLNEAEPLMRRALAIDEESYGPDHPDVSASSISLLTSGSRVRSSGRIAVARHDEAQNHIGERMHGLRPYRLGRRSKRVVCVGRLGVPRMIVFEVFRSTSSQASTTSSHLARSSFPSRTSPRLALPMMASDFLHPRGLGTAIDQIDDGLGGLLCVHGLPPPRVTITRRHAGKSLADGIGMSARRKEREDQDDQQKCKKGNCYECMHLKAPNRLQQTVQPTQNREIFLKRNRKNIQTIVK